MEQVVTAISPTMMWTFLITTIIGTFTAIFKSTIFGYFSDLFRDRKLYNNRRVDEDGDPAEGEFCTVNSKTDDSKWGFAFVREYKWSWIFPSKRKIHVSHYDGDTGLWVETKYSYPEWFNISVGSVPKKDQVLLHKLKSVLITP